MTAPVDVDLAASIVAMWQLVRDQLSAERPQVGHIGEQARAAFDRTRGIWGALTHDACRELAGEATDDYCDQLAQVIDDKAAEGLTAGMNLLLDRGWHPEVAWHKALPGYGLDARRMRGLVAGIMPVPNASGAAVTPDPSGRTAVRTLLAYAETLAGKEVSAWSHVHEMAKAYDPQERRDSDGKWTRDPTMVKEKEVDPLAGVGVAEETDRYAGLRPQGDDRYAALRGATQDRYAALRYAGLQPPPASTAPEEDRYAALRAASGDRYAALKPPERGRRHVVHHYLLSGFTKPLGGPPPPPPDDDDDGGFPSHNYVSLADLAGFYDKSGSDLSPDPDDPDFSGFASDDDEPVGVGQGNFIDFGVVQQHLRGNSEAPSERIGVTTASDPFDIVPKIDIDQQTWDDVMPIAKTFWDRAITDPITVASHLSDQDIREIGERAGYGKKHGAATLREQIATDSEARVDNPMSYDPGLLRALIDYAVWVKPEALRNTAATNGDQRTELPDNETSFDFYTDDALEDLKDLRAVVAQIPPGETKEIPAVVEFSGGFDQADDRDRSDLGGRYWVSYVHYRSATEELGRSAPVGVIGVKELQTHPSQRV